MEDMKVQISEEVLRDACEWLNSLKMRYNLKAMEAKSNERARKWKNRADEVQKTMEAIYLALVEAEEQEG